MKILEKKKKVKQQQMIPFLRSFKSLVAILLIKGNFTSRFEKSYYHEWFNF